MTTATENITRKRTEWGSTVHYYKGVRISHFGSKYEAIIEGFIWEASKFSMRDRYLSYQLKHAPNAIDELLESGNFFVCEKGLIHMTQNYKKEIIQKNIDSLEKDIADLHNKVFSLLCNKSYNAVEKGAHSLFSLSSRLTGLNIALEEITA